MKQIKETLLLLLGFLPWILFLFLSGHSLARLERAIIVCLVAAIVCGFHGIKKGFILQWGTLVFFVFCFASVNLFKIVWVAIYMSILANGTLALIMWGSVLSGKPFVLQYARENLPKDKWNDPKLIRSCRFMTIVWGILMLLALAVSIFKMTQQGLYPEWVYFDASLLIIIGGITFTIIYKHHKRKPGERNNLTVVDL